MKFLIDAIRRSYVGIARVIDSGKACASIKTGNIESHSNRKTSCMNNGTTLVRPLTTGQRHRDSKKSGREGEGEGGSENAHWSSAKKLRGHSYEDCRVHWTFTCMEERTRKSAVCSTPSYRRSLLPCSRFCEVIELIFRLFVHFVLFALFLSVFFYFYWMMMSFWGFLNFVVRREVDILWSFEIHPIFEN